VCKKYLCSDPPQSAPAVEYSAFSYRGISNNTQRGHNITHIAIHLIQHLPFDGHVLLQGNLKPNPA